MILAHVMNANKRKQIPLWLKISYTIMVSIIVPIYWNQYGPKNFLWFCDIALLVMLPAIWIESQILTSMMALGVLPLEIFWFVGFFSAGYIFTTADYMFDTSLPFYLRMLSLFHFPLPAVIIYMLIKLRYNPLALPLQILLVAALLPATRLLTPKDENINWVFQPAILANIPTYLYISLMFITLVLLVYIPVHLLLKKFFYFRR